MVSDSVQGKRPVLQNSSVLNNNADQLTISGQGLAAAKENEATESPRQKSGAEEAKEDNSVQTPPEKTRTPSGQELSERQRQQLQDLKRRDAQVKAHEQAHLSAAGNLAKGGASFDYETGSDGKRYAVGGEVNIDTSRVSDDPQANLNKAQQIRRAATAPADPSAQDRSVASEAARMEAQARVELSAQVREKQTQSATENTPQADFLSRQSSQTEKDIQDTYQTIQKASALEQPRSFVDFFI